MHAFRDRLNNWDSEDTLRKVTREHLLATAIRIHRNVPGLSGEMLQKSLGLASGTVNTFIDSGAERMHSTSKGFFPAFHEGDRNELLSFAEAVFVQHLIEWTDDQTGVQLASRLPHLLSQPVRRALKHRVRNAGEVESLLFALSHKPTLAIGLRPRAAASLQQAIAYLVTCATHAKLDQDRPVRHRLALHTVADDGGMRRPVDLRERVRSGDIHRDSASIYREAVEQLFESAIDLAARFCNHRLGAGAVLLMIGGLAPTLPGEAAWSRARDRVRPAFVGALKHLGGKWFIRDTVAAGLRAGTREGEPRQCLDELTSCLGRAFRLTHHRFDEEQLEEFLLDAEQNDLITLRPEMAPLLLVRHTGRGAAQRCSSEDMPRRVRRLGWPPGIDASLKVFRASVEGIRETPPCLDTAIAMAGHMCAVAPKEYWAELQYWIKLLRASDADSLKRTL
jgi:hypothetical protein